MRKCYYLFDWNLQWSIMHHCSLPQNYSPPLIHFLHPLFPQSATKHRPHCVNYASKYGISQFVKMSLIIQNIVFFCHLVVVGYRSYRTHCVTDIKPSQWVLILMCVQYFQRNVIPPSSGRMRIWCHIGRCQVWSWCVVEPIGLVLHGGPFYTFSVYRSIWLGPSVSLPHFHQSGRTTCAYIWHNILDWFWPQKMNFSMYHQNTNSTALVYIVPTLKNRINVICFMFV